MRRKTGLGMKAQAESQTIPGRCRPATNITIRAAAPAASCTNVSCDRVAMDLIVMKKLICLSVLVATLFSYLKQPVKNFMRTLVNFLEQKILTH
jgi:hypothetical protein